jgi:hypothetical protein
LRRGKRSVAEFLPNFETNVRKALRELLGEEGEKRIKMGMAKDGSGVGGERETFFYFWGRPFLSTRFVTFIGADYGPAVHPAALCALQAKKAEEQGAHPQVDSVVPTEAEAKQ